MAPLYPAVYSQVWPRKIYWVPIVRPDWWGSWKALDKVRVFWHGVKFWCLGIIQHTVWGASRCGLCSHLLSVDQWLSKSIVINSTSGYCMDLAIPESGLPKQSHTHIHTRVYIWMHMRARINTHTHTHTHTHTPLCRMERGCEEGATMDKLTGTAYEVFCLCSKSTPYLLHPVLALVGWPHTHGFPSSVASSWV